MDNENIQEDVDSKRYMCTIIKASIKDKPFGFFSRKPSTFVEISLNNESSHRTHTIFKSLKPKWASTFEINVVKNSFIKISLINTSGSSIFNTIASLNLNSNSLFNQCNSKNFKYITVLKLQPEGIYKESTNFDASIELRFRFKSETISGFQISRDDSIPHTSTITTTDTSIQTNSITQNLENNSISLEAQNEYFFLQNQNNPTTARPLNEPILNQTTIQSNNEPLPPGWEIKYNSSGRPYYIDHNTSSTSWDPPQALPPGWEKRVDGKGRTYYVDHNTRTTSWQRPTIESVANYNRYLNNRQNNIESDRVRANQRFHYENNNTHGYTPIESINAPSTVVSENKDDQNIDLLGPLPEGWEKRFDNKTNRSYFVDHRNKITSWDDPRLYWLISDINPLPVGWIVRVNEIGIPFFLNINTRITTYKDPRTGISLFPSSSLTLQRNKQFKEKSLYFRHLCQVHTPVGNLKLPIDRESLFESSFEQIMRHQPNDLRRKLFISIKGEAGLDYGGISREWFFQLSNEFMNPMYCLFEYVNASQDYIIQINPCSSINPNHLLYYRFIGRILALALFHCRFIDRGFSTVFYKKLLGRRCVLKDLEAMDQEFFNSLQFVKENNIEECDLDLYFCTEIIKLGELRLIDLKSNGRDIKVTESTKEEYIKLLADWRLNRDVEDQTKAILTGFAEILPLTWVQYFDEKELELMLCGLQEYDIADLRKNTRFKNGYTHTSKQVVWFFEFVESLSVDQQARLLQFITGTCRIPAGGFADLMGSNGPQIFCLEKWGTPENLPRSHTCFNRLDLPPYETKEQLFSKLIYAIQETDGFHEE